MKDPAKMACDLPDCGQVAEAKIEWKFGKGVEIPFLGGVCGNPTGMHHVLMLCRDHRIEAMQMDMRPFKATLTAWAQDPARFTKHITVDEAGHMQFVQTAVVK